MNGSSVRPGALPAGPGRTAGALLDPTWRFLLRPWPLILVAGATLLLALIALMLPQMPGQYGADPVAASRWLLSVRSGYGPVGILFQNLGLFTFMTSQTVRLLLAAISLLVMVHLADLIGVALRYQRLPQQLALPGHLIGQEPFSIPGSGPLYRVRRAWEARPEGSMDQIRARLPDGFHLAAATGMGDTQADPPAREKEAVRAEAGLLAVYDGRFALLRPLWGVGVSTGLVGIWWMVHFGWSVTTPSLAPGQEFVYSSQQVSLHYRVDMQGAQAFLETQIGERTGTLSVTSVVTAGGGMGGQHMQLGVVDIIARPGPPGLVLRTDRPTLAVAGQSRVTDTIGLIFPGAGSEESVTVPEQESGLRIVRLAAAETTFLVEVFDSQGMTSGQPAQRVEFDARQPTTMWLGDKRVRLDFYPMAGLDVDTRAVPGRWLIWPALLLIVVGSIGFAGRPAFLLVQVSPWPDQRAVVILQSDRRELVAMAQEGVGEAGTDV